tara:strand:+ start:378 stop:536 length:159 start_codon:yes stop_codon:yes gene_type:complete
MKKITGKQLRMTRASLKYIVDDISKKTGVPWSRIQYMKEMTKNMSQTTSLMI